MENYKTSLGPSEKFAREQFIFVYQDVRGRYMSEGDFVNMTPHRAVKRGPADTDESTDTYDTIEWLTQAHPQQQRQRRHVGHLVPGLLHLRRHHRRAPRAQGGLPAGAHRRLVHRRRFPSQRHALPAAHVPLLFELRPSAPRAHPAGRRRHTNLALTQQDGYSFFLGLGPLSNINEKFFKNDVPFWTEMTQHANYDEFWQARDLRRHLKNIKPAVMTVGGWFDAEDLFGALNTYKEIEKNSPGANNMLVMGPWYHGGWSRSDGDALGRVQFGSKTAVFYRDEIEFPFFNHWLKGKDDPKLPEAFVFETGTNQWRKEDAWPPKDAQQKTLYFHADGRLSFDAPKESGAAFDEYISDPAKPVPYIGGQGPGMTREHMVEDQRFASTRTDVLTYQTDVLDTDVTLAGPLTASLFVSTTRHRFRLGGEADRCLSRRLSRSRPESHRHPHGRLPATGTRRSHARQVPQQLFQTRALHAGQDGKGGVGDA